SAQKLLGIEMSSYVRSSTDANAPMGAGIPSTCLGTGGRGVHTHNLKEYFEMVDTHLGPQLIMLTSLALVGLEDEAPLLPKRA
ncbi:MAG: peptidase M20, partial [Burkholderiaceae bacterium]|nr:peptidase M20 [Burkholderiaceae bacterium]